MHFVWGKHFFKISQKYEVNDTSEFFENPEGNVLVVVDESRANGKVVITIPCRERRK